MRRRWHALRTVTPDDGHAISYKVLRRGTPVRASDGVEVGRVRRVLDNARENIFDGIVVDTSDGQKFVDAPEVVRVAERGVTLSITPAEVARLPAPRGGLSERMAMSTTARRAKRFGRGLRERWERR